MPRIAVSVDEAVAMANAAAYGNGCQRAEQIISAKLTEIKSHKIKDEDNSWMET